MTTDQPRPDSTGAENSTEPTRPQPRREDSSSVAAGYDPSLGYAVQGAPYEASAAAANPSAANVPAVPADSARPTYGKRAWLAGAALLTVGLAAGSGITAAVMENGSGGSGTSASQGGEFGGPGGGQGPGGASGQNGQGQRGGPPNGGSGQRDQSGGQNGSTTAPSTQPSAGG